MDITAFFQQSAGKWFSQRTSHHLPYQQSESGKSNLVIELLETNDPDVVKLCEHYEIDPALALCGARVNWDGAMEWDNRSRPRSTLLVPIANPDQPSQGMLLRHASDSSTPTSGRYIMGDDEALTLITEQDTVYSEERLWFASPNLRLRTTLLKQADGFSMASFCSEIRLGVTAPAS